MRKKQTKHRRRQKTRINNFIKTKKKYKFVKKPIQIKIKILKKTVKHKKHI